MNVVVVDPADSSRKGKFDSLTKEPTNISHTHHEIHEGNSYMLATVFDGVLDAGVINIGVTTPDVATWAHVTAEVDSDGAIEIFIYKDSTFTGGTSATAVNQNGNSLNTSIMTLVAAPTISDVGTLVAHSKAGGGTNPVKKQSGQVGNKTEWILKQNASYIFRIINISGGTGYIAPTLSWYEHTNE